MQPEHPRAQPLAGFGRAGRGGHDVAALDENLAIERDADRLSGAWRRAARATPSGTGHASIDLARARAFRPA